MAAVELDVMTNTETIMTSHTEIKELNSTLQRLQIELQSHLSMVCHHEKTMKTIIYWTPHNMTPLQKITPSVFKETLQQLYSYV